MRSNSTKLDSFLSQQKAQTNQLEDEQSELWGSRLAKSASHNYKSSEYGGHFFYLLLLFPLQVATQVHMRTHFRVHQVANARHP